MEKDENGFVAFCLELDGCYSQGDTIEELIVNILDAIQTHIKYDMSLKADSENLRALLSDDFIESIKEARLDYREGRIKSFEEIFS